MMPDKWLREAAARARQERPPTVDVTARVTARIHGQYPESYDPMPIIAGTSAAAALVVAAYAVQTWWNLQDPMSSLLASINMVLQ